MRERDQSHADQRCRGCFGRLAVVHRAREIHRGGQAVDFNGQVIRAIDQERSQLREAEYVDDGMRTSRARAGRDDVSVQRHRSQIVREHREPRAGDRAGQGELRSERYRLGIEEAVSYPIGSGKRRDPRDVLGRMSRIVGGGSGTTVHIDDRSLGRKADQEKPESNFHAPKA